MSIAAPLAALPTIEQSPVDTTFAPGEALALSVTATGTGLSYQWQKNGRTLDGETAATLTVTDAQVRDAGWYRVVVSDAEGAVVSDPVMVTVDAPMSEVRSLKNLSVRARLSAWEPLQIPVRITGTGTKTLLLRGVGPTLANFGVSNVAQAVRLNWTQADGTVLTSNEGWDQPGWDAERVETVSAAVGAFALNADSADAALVLDAAPGRYVLEIWSPEGGVALAEVFEADGSAPTARLASVAAKVHGDSGGQIAMAGFVQVADGRDVLLRLLGPGLPAPRVVEAPSLELGAFGTVVASYDSGWDADKVPPALFAAVGLPALEVGSADIAAVLNPGSAALSALPGGSTDPAEDMLLEVTDLINPAPVLAPELILAPESPGDLVAGGTLSLGAYVAGAEPLSYAWRKDGVVIEGVEQARLVLSNLSHEMNGSYEVTVSNAYGSVVVGVGTVSVLQPATIETQPVPATASTGGDVTFSVAAAGSGVIRYQWYKDGEILLGERDATLTLGNVTAADRGEYQVEVTNNYGTVRSTAVTLSGEQPWPTSTLTPGDVVATIGEDVTLALTTDATAPVLQWRRNGFVLEGATGNSLTLSDVTMLESDVYEVVIQDAPSLSEEVIGVRVDVFPETIVEQAQLDPDRAIEFWGGPTSLLGAMGLPDNSVLVFGRFGEIDGHRTRNIARLSALGEVDETFVHTEDEFALNPTSAKLHGATHWLAFSVAQPLPGRARAQLLRYDFQGNRDPDFAVDAAVFGELGATGLHSFAVAPDLSLFVAVRLAQDSPDGAAVAVVRLAADGTWDQNFEPVSFDSADMTMLVLPDGGLLVTGAMTTANAETVDGAAVISAAGVVDATRSAALDLGDILRDGFLDPLAVDGDGGVFITGRTDQSGAWVLDHLQADGQRTARWSTNGNVYELVDLPDGRRVVLGSFTEFGGEARGRAVVLETDGSVSGPGGAGSNWSITRLGVTPDGILHLAGSNSSEQRDFLARYALATEDFTELELARRGLGLITGLVPLGSGEWLVGGDFDTVAGVTSHNLVRLNHALEVVGTYAAPFDGAATLVSQLSRRTDGKIDVLALNAGIYRLDTNGGWDQSFVFDSTVYDEQALHLLSLPAGRLMASSWYLYYDSADRDTKTVTIVDEAGVRDPAYLQPISESPFTDGVVLPDGGTLSVGLGLPVRRLRDGRVDPDFVQPATGISYYIGVDRAVDGAAWYFAINRLARVDAAGTVAISDGDSGVIGFDLVNNQFAARTLPMPDGGLLVANYSWAIGWEPALAQPVAWLRSDLSPKPGFQVEGIADQVTALALEPSGTWLLGLPGWLRGTRPLVDIAPSIDSQPASVTVRAGEDAVLSVGAAGTTLSYQWRRQGEPIDGAVSATFTLAGAALSDSGWYDVVITNAAGTVTSARARLRVFPSEDPGRQALDPDWGVELEREGGALDTVAATADGGFVIAGDFIRINGHDTTSLAKFDAAGAVESTFASQVEVYGDIGDVVEVADGRLLVGGPFLAQTPVGLVRGLLRLNADGSFDPSFRATAPGPGWIQRFAADAVGRIYLIGADGFGRLQANGTRDDNYAAGGMIDGELTAVVVSATGQATVAWRSGTTPRVYQFDANGVFLRELPVGDFSAISALALGPNDAVTIYGLLKSFSGGWRRFTADGEADTAFAGGGAYPITRDVAVLPDGGLLASSSIDLVAVNAEGERIGSSLFAATYNLVSRVAVDTTGRGLMICSDRSREEPLLVLKRYNSDLSEDPAVTLTAVSRGLVSEMVRQADGRVVVAGEFDRVSGESQANLVRLTADGSLDPTFAVYGVNGAINDLHALADGSLLIAGGFTEVNANPRNGVATLSADGVLNGGIVPPAGWTDLASADFLTGVIPLTDGGVLVQARVTLPGQSSPKSHLYKLDAGGLPNETFQTNLSAWASQLEVVGGFESADGTIVVAGRDPSRADQGRVYRINADGTRAPGATDWDAGVGTLVDARTDGDGLLWYLGEEGWGRSESGGTSRASLTRAATTEAWVDRPLVGLRAIPQMDGSRVVFGSRSFAPGSGPVERRDFAARLAADGSLLDGFLVAGLGQAVAAAVQQDDGQFVFAAGGRVRRTQELATPLSGLPAGGGLYASGDTVVLRAELTQGVATTYQWYRDGEPIAGADRAILVVDSVDPDAAGTYVVAVGNAAGVTFSPGTLVEVLAPLALASGHHELVDSGEDPAEVARYTVANSVEFTGSPDEVAWSVLIPTGWGIEAEAAEGAESQIDPTAGLAEWRWTAPATSPLVFHYDLIPPTEARGRVAVAALLEVTRGGEASEATAKPDPLYVRRVSRSAHAADVDGDFRLSLSELLRVIELYNTRRGTERTGRYRLDERAEDRFATDPNRSGGAILARYHSADTDADGALSLSELLRVIELYNTRSGTQRTGAYRGADGTDDGFEPGES